MSIKKQETRLIFHEHDAGNDDDNNNNDDVDDFEFQTSSMNENYPPP